MTASEATRPSAIVAKAEQIVGARVEAILGDYFILARDLTDHGAAMIEDALLARKHTEPSAFHAVAILASRLLTELQAVVHLVRLGYAAQAFTLSGTMFELWNAAYYIGADESRAREYFNWSNERPGENQRYGYGGRASDRRERRCDLS